MSLLLLVKKKKNSEGVTNSPDEHWCSFLGNRAGEARTDIITIYRNNKTARAVQSRPEPLNPLSRAVWAASRNLGSARLDGFRLRAELVATLLGGQAWKSFSLSCPWYWFNCCTNKPDTYLSRSKESLVCLILVKDRTIDGLLAIMLTIKYFVICSPPLGMLVVLNVQPSMEAVYHFHKSLTAYLRLNLKIPDYGRDSLDQKSLC